MATVIPPRTHRRNPVMDGLRALEAAERKAAKKKPREPETPTVDEERKAKHIARGKVSMGPQRARELEAQKKPAKNKPAGKAKPTTLRKGAK